MVAMAYHRTGELSDEYKDAMRAVHRPLSVEEERDLCRRMKAGDMDARDTLAYSVLPWAWKRARRFLRPAVDADDLMQLAAIAVLRSLRTYDAEQSRLITYVSLSVDNFLAQQSCSIEGGPIRLPAHSHKTAPDAVAKVRDTYSLDFYFTNDDGGEIGEAFVGVLADGSTNVADAMADAEEKAANIARVRAAIAKLPRREADVIVSRFTQTLDEISVRLGLTRERVRQIEEQAHIRLHRLLGKDPPKEIDLDSLPQEQRAIAEMLKEGYEHKDIASLLGVHHGRVQRLAKQLEQGGICERN